jgi:ankyrin repeat protein
MRSRRAVSIGLACAAFAMPGLAATATEFFQAIRNGDSAQIKSLSQEKANLALADNKGVTPLHYAAAFGNFEGFKMLVDAGANVNAKESSDNTPLHWAACDPARVKLLVEHGADVKAKTNQGRTPLMVASSCTAAAEAVQFLLEKGADVSVVETSTGVTALHVAAAYGGPRIATMLLAAGAKPDVADKGGFTPLQSAVGFNDIGLVEKLLAMGAAVNSKNTFAGKVQNGDIALKELTPLMQAAPFGSPELIKKLLDAGADVKMRDVRGMTPLMMSVASDRQDIRVMKMLIERGSDVNAKAANGETVLDWARKFNEPAVVALLEKAGARGSTMDAAPVRKAAPLSDPKAAAALSVKLLQTNAQTFFKMSGCVGCHHQPMMTMAVKAARKGGVPVDEMDMAEQVKTMTTLLSPRPSRMLLMQAPGGGLDNLALGILGLEAAGVKADLLSDSTAVYIAARQLDNGGWEEAPTTSRAPMQESEISRAVYCMRVLQVYAIPSRKAEFEQRVAKARAWLEEAKPRHTYEQADLLMGLYWAGASGDRVKRVATALLREQRDDGGWAQRKTLASDAYATGMVLRALRESGQLRAGDSAHRKGTDYLLQTQMEDGSWYVRSRAMKLQPYFQSGFPYDHDQWISYSATAYAAVALAGAEGKERAAR